MTLELSHEQASELAVLLDGALRDLSHEIAATDNARFRSELMERRRLLYEVADTLHAVAPAHHLGDSEAVSRELSHPGA